MSALMHAWVNSTRLKLVVNLAHTAFVPTSTLHLKPQQSPMLQQDSTMSITPTLLKSNWMSNRTILIPSSQFFTPTIENNVFSARSDFLPASWPVLSSTSEAIKEQVLDLLGFSAPGALPNLPPSPSPMLQVSNTSHEEAISSLQDADNDELDDHDLFTPSQGDITTSNVTQKLLHKTQAVYDCCM
ncbi:hypothetical protein L208DRAFT_1377458 [Tricholoma matsutake]|nr:hypothetical protein L208DRAFT_1377458 [Tricholoma matsutake 945]